MCVSFLVSCCWEESEEKKQGNEQREPWGQMAAYLGSEQMDIENAK